MLTALAFIIAAIVTWVAIRLLNAADTPRGYRNNPNQGWWTRENTAKADARLGRNALFGVPIFLFLASILLRAFGKA